MNQQQLARPTERTAANAGAQGRLSRGPSWQVPRANIREEKDAYILELEMPGVPKDGLEVTVESNELTIVGHRRVAEPNGEVVYRESRPLDYRRVFDLDPSIDVGRISARVDQGIVAINLPKTEAVKPRKIQVTE